jgi:hypothetical protein
MILRHEEEHVLAAVSERLAQIERMENLGYHQGRVYLKRDGRPMVVSVYKRYRLLYAVDTDEYLVERREPRYVTAATAAA